MNLFSILSSGNRLLKEEHISAVLGWLLDPTQDHGLGYVFLSKFIQLAFPDSPLSVEIDSAGKYSGLTIRDRAKLLVSVELEKEVKVNEHNRSIDIVINVSDRFLIAIENKINTIAAQHGQLSEEAQGILRDEKSVNKQVYMIYLVPDKGLNAAKQEIASIPAGIESHILTWDGDNSVISLIRQILQDETCGLIDPLPSESLFILKSLCIFAENKFSYPVQTMAAASRGGSYEKLYRGFIELKNEEKDGYIGYYGGLVVLRNDIHEAKSDITKRERLLNNRPYKWIAQRTNDHDRNNWIAYLDFIKEFDPIII